MRARRPRRVPPLAAPLLASLLTAGLGLAACAAPEPAAEPAPDAPRVETGGTEELAHAAHEAPSASRSEHGHGRPDVVALEEGAAPAPPNRDGHGMADVDRYIEVLQSADRVAELRVPEVVAALALAPDAVVADVGCGPGVFALPFAAAVPRGLVYAVDVEPRQLDAVRALLLERGVHNVVPVLASFEDPHLPPGGVDLIFVADTYHHLQDRVAYLRGLAADLAPGGRLALLEYKPGDLPVGPPASHKLPAGVMEAELAEAGFERAQTFDLHTWHDFAVWRPRE